MTVSSPDAKEQSARWAFDWLNARLAAGEHPSDVAEEAVEKIELDFPTLIALALADTRRPTAILDVLADASAIVAPAHTDRIRSLRNQIDRSAPGPASRRLDRQPALTLAGA